jgi:hypothetical protein
MPALKVPANLTVPLDKLRPHHAAECLRHLVPSWSQCRDWMAAIQARHGLTRLPDMRDRQRIVWLPETPLPLLGGRVAIESTLEKHSDLGEVRRWVFTLSFKHTYDTEVYTFCGRSSYDSRRDVWVAQRLAEIIRAELARRASAVSGD